MDLSTGDAGDQAAACEAHRPEAGRLKRQLCRGVHARQPKPRAVQTAAQPEIAVERVVSSHGRVQLVGGKAEAVGGRFSQGQPALPAGVAKGAGQLSIKHSRLVSQPGLNRDTPQLNIGDPYPLDLKVCLGLKSGHGRADPTATQTAVYQRSDIAEPIVCQQPAQLDPRQPERSLIARRLLAEIGCGLNVKRGPGRLELPGRVQLIRPAAELHLTRQIVPERQVGGEPEHIGLPELFQDEGHIQVKVGLGRVHIAEPAG